MTFSYDESRMSAQEIEPGDKLQVSIDVTNTGNRVGKEVVKISLQDVASVKLEPAERKTVTLTIGWEALAYYEDLAHEWVDEAREFEVLVGASSQDIRATSTFALTTTSRFGGFREHENVST